MGFRLAFYYSLFITSGLNVLASLILLSLHGVEPERRDELFAPYYILLRLELAFHLVELMISLVRGQITVPLTVIGSALGRVPVVTWLIDSNYSCFSLLMGLLYSLSDLTRALYAADILDVGEALRVTALARYNFPIWFHPLTIFGGEAILYLRKIWSYTWASPDRELWRFAALFYFSAFPLFHFVNYWLRYRAVTRPALYAEQQAYLEATRTRIENDE